jgi:trehalose 6-phosphate phosphatase
LISTADRTRRTLNTATNGVATLFANASAPSPLSTDALFLDIDGTLLEIAATPSSVHVPQHLIELLYQVWVLMDGALALISGRELVDVDRLFAPYRFPGAGMHGCELRPYDRSAPLPRVDKTAIERLHEACARLTVHLPGALIEYKSCGVAIHYRLAPDMENSINDCAQTLLSDVGAGFHLLRGKHVCEIKPARYSKGTAILQLMTGVPFLGRRPIYIGDDVTDEDGFEAVNGLGGISIRVGYEGASLAQQRFGRPRDVHLLLAQLLTQSYRAARHTEAHRAANKC